MPTKLDSLVTLKVNGTAIKDQDLDDLVELVVDTDAFLPAMFSVTLLDDENEKTHSMKYADSDTFKIGAPVEITMEVNWDGIAEKIKGQLFAGEITSVEPVYGRDSKPLFRVRGYDRSHRLTRGKKTRTFGDGQPGSISEQQIISKIIQDAGLSSKIDSSGISSLKYPYMMQYNQSDWDYLWSRACQVGYQVYCDDKTLCFQKADTARKTGQPVTLEWGNNLTSFEPRISLMNQVSETAAYGWNPDQKTAFVGQATSAATSNAPKTGISDTGSAALKKAFGAAEDVVVDQPAFTVDLLKAIAGADFSARESNFIQASGYLADGNPNVLAGCQVKIANVGKRFSGTYTVTKARHHISRGQYTVNFDLSGSSPHTLYSLLHAGRAPESKKVSGAVIGLVTEINDPDNLGRIKVKFPWLTPGGKAGELSSNWARLATLGGGKDRGIFFTPEINDEVLVAFDHGDINFPFIIGGLWNKKDTPPKGTSAKVQENNKVNQRVIRSRSGHAVILDDTENKEQIIIQDKDGQNSIVIDSKEDTITFKSKKDFVIEAGGKFIVKSQGDMTFDSKANAQFSLQQGFTVDSKKEVVLKAPGGNQVSIKMAGVEVAGMKVDVKANSLLSLNGQGIAEIKGGLVKIN